MGISVKKNAKLDEDKPGLSTPKRIKLHQDSSEVIIKKKKDVDF